MELALLAGVIFAACLVAILLFATMGGQAVAWPEEAKSEFIASCMQRAQSAAYCECALDVMIDEYVSLEELLADLDARPHSEIPALSRARVECVGAPKASDAA